MNGKTGQTGKVVGVIYPEYVIVVAHKHGMQASEVCNLRLDDIDLKNGSIVVERLKGSLRTTQAVTEHRGEPLLNEHRALRKWQ